MTSPVELTVKVKGLNELRRGLTSVDPALAKTLRVGLKRAATVVADEAKTRVPVRSGRARGSIRATTSGARAFVKGGKDSVPYYGWLDFGARTPRSGFPRRHGPWADSGRGPALGRFIYPALEAKRDEVIDLVAKAVENAERAAGLK